MDVLCDVVHLANGVAKHVEITIAKKKAVIAVNADCLQRLGMDMPKAEKLSADTLLSFQKVGGLFGAT